MLAVLALIVYGQQTDTTVTVPPGTRLDVSNPSGSIVVKAWAQRGVRVHADHESADLVQVTLEGTVLRVKTGSRRSSPREVYYIISAPAAMPLALSGVKTDIDVDGAQAPVTVETVNGQVNCRGGSGLDPRGVRPPLRKARPDRRGPRRKAARSPWSRNELTASRARAKRPAHSALSDRAGGRGGIGRHARLRISCRKAWGFKSLRPHQTEKMEVKQCK